MITSGSPSSSLRYRWSRLDTMQAGRCIEEHNRLIHDLERCMSEGTSRSSMHNNGKVRGLVQAVMTRQEDITNFIAQHRAVYGLVDADRIREFEDLLIRLRLAEEKAFSWSENVGNRSRQSAALLPHSGKCSGVRKRITFSPSAVTPEKLAEQRRSSGKHQTEHSSVNYSSEVGGEQRVKRVPSLDELQSMLDDIQRFSSRSGSALSSSSGLSASKGLGLLYDWEARHHNQPNVDDASRSCSISSQARRSSDPLLHVGHTSDALQWRYDSSDTDDFGVHKNKSCRSRADIPRGFLLDSTFLVDEATRRTAILNSEYFLRKEMYIQRLRSAPTGYVTAPPSAAPDLPDFSALLGSEAVTLLQQQRTRVRFWQQASIVILALVVLSVALTCGVKVLAEIDDLLDSFRPNGGTAYR